MLNFKQFCALLLWIHLLTFVQCEKVCTVQEFKQSSLFNENLNPSNLDSSYKQGKSVRVPCEVGYRGFFRLICSDQGWVSQGEGCRRILCGHPGDVQFADFKLIVGTDYDFGSKVEYTCHKGYQMTSYTSTRNCLQGGWDGHLPECEPIPCPSVTVDNKVLVYGDLNQPTSGSVLQFSCSSRDDELVGASQIFCDENGNWDKSPPICKAISCSKPPLENFEVEGDKEEYKKDEFLRYSCNPGYRKVDGRPSQCKKVGQSSQWTPMPQCELITCRLSSTPPEETTYNPQNRIRFKPNETVMVSCGEKYFVKSREFQSAELTCQDSGDWDFEPLCRPVTCFRHDQALEHVERWRSPTRTWNRWYRTFYSPIPTVEMDETLEYRCDSNYVEKSATATCTRRGWEPDPLCEEISCTKPQLKNFTVEEDKEVYKKNEALIYSCNPSYKKVDEILPRCQKEGHSSKFIPEPDCEEKICKLSYNPKGTTYNPKNKFRFRPNEIVTVSCGEKYWVKSVHNQSAVLTCLDTEKWDFEPVCQEVSCFKQAEHVNFWDPTRLNTVKMDKAVRYQCDGDHEEASLTATCIRGGWEPNPLCKEISCTKPQLKNFTVEGDKEVYKKNDVLRYSCNPGYRKKVVVHEIKPQCQKHDRSSQWIPKPYCEPIKCKLSDYPPKGTTYNPQNQIRFRPNETVTVSCAEELWVKSKDRHSAVLTCLDTGEWDFEPECQEITCSKPQLENLQVEGKKTEYKKDEILRYSCNPGYRKVNESLPQCKKVGQSLQWTSMPQCEPITCKLNSTLPEGTTYNPKNQTDFRPKKTVTVSCEGKLWVKSPNLSSAELTCQDTGDWDFKPVCQAITCKLDSIPPEGTTYNKNQPVFRPNETVTVICGEKLWVNNTELRTTELTCQDTGKWDFEPVCRPVTCYKQDERVYAWEQTESDLVDMDETVEYRCYSRFYQPSLGAKCTRQGWEPNPLCKGA